MMSTLLAQTSVHFQNQGKSGKSKSKREVEIESIDSPHSNRSEKNMTSKPKTIDEYLATISDDKRNALEKLRKDIIAAAPKVEECIAYSMPAFRLNGKLLVCFRAAARHCAFHPMSALTVEAHADDLKGYDTSKGTIRFQAEKPLPAALVRKLVKARIAEING